MHQPTAASSPRQFAPRTPARFSWPVRGAQRLATLTRAPLAALLLLVACATPATRAPDLASRPLLNSERIEQRFGSYALEVLEADDQVRVSNLSSGEGDQRVCRTLAVVVFPAPIDPRLAAEHRTIVAGGSIGATLVAAGWTVSKRHLLVGEIAGPGPHDRLYTLMKLPGPTRLAIDVYAMTVSRDGVTLDYAILAEVHHPDYLDLGQLQRLVGGEVPSRAAGDPRLEGLLDLVATAMRGRVVSPRP